MMRVALLLTTGYLLAADAPSHLTDCYNDKGNDHSYWSWRVIDGKKCWYHGRPGRPKTELRWQSVDDSAPSSAAKQDGAGGVLITSPVSVPEPEPVAMTPEPAPWHASAEDMLLAFTCCWPELSSFPSEPAAAELKPQAPMAPPHELTWPWALLPIIVYIAYRLFGLHLMRGGTA